MTSAADDLVQMVRDGKPITFPTTPEDVRFRPGKGGEMTHEWAAYMLNLWWSARDKKLTFSEAIKTTTLHFMVEDQP